MASRLSLTELAIVGLAVVCLGMSLVECFKPAHARARVAACGEIRDPDRRHFCKALSIPSPTECEFIKAHDLRVECRVRVQK